MSVKFVKKHKYSIIIIIFFLFMLPSTIALPSQTDTRAIVTGISIDKEESDFNVALQLITPQSNLSNNENIEIVEDKGETFFNCINNLGIKLGKVVGFEHTNIIIFGESVNGEDIMNILDYLYRNSKITLSTIIVQADKSAKKVLESSAELNNNSSSSLQNNLGFNTDIIETSNVVSLGKFFNDYFSFSKTSLIPLIEEPSQTTSNQGGQGGQSTQNSNTGGTQGQSNGGKADIEPLIKNNGESAVYKNGRYVARLTRELTNGFSWLDERTIKGLVKVNNVTDNKYYKNSTVSVQIERSKTKINTTFENNELVFNVNLDLYCYVGEIASNDTKSFKIMQSDETYLTKELRDKMKEKIDNVVQTSLEYCKTSKLDIFNFYDRFYRHNKNGLKKVLGVYGEDYLDACKIKLNIQIYPYK